MTITDDKMLREIQRDFNGKFPYLKIEFYSGSHGQGEGSPVETRLNPELTLAEVRKIHNEGDMNIDGHLKVGTFESNFLEKYGLNVQVFRKSGNLWMQTTSTDGWTLSQQNRKGGASELHFKEKYTP
jgi:hypothetical protein